MRKLAIVQKELEEAKNKRNLAVQTIETMQTDCMILVLSFGHGNADGETFDLEVPEMVIPYHLKTSEEQALQAQAEAYYLKTYQKELNRLSKKIEALELEETNIFHTLATPLEEHELS
jgi:hypothetical protein